MPQNPETSWETHFGEAAALQLPEVGLELAITVPERYYHSVVRGAVQKTKGTVTPEAIREFCDDAARKWHERHRNDKMPATKEAIDRVKALVPNAEAGLPFKRLTATLAGACRDEALGRLLLRRYGSAGPRAKTLALREAFLEAANEALGRT